MKNSKKKPFFMKEFTIFVDNYEENPSENFLEFVRNVEKTGFSPDYSKILNNLKVFISAFPSIEEIVELYKNNFVR